MEKSFATIGTPSGKIVIKENTKYEKHRKVSSYTDWVYSVSKRGSKKIFKVSKP